MLDLQMKMLAAMAEISTAWTTGMLDSASDGPQGTNRDKPSPDEQRSQAFALPNVPTSGRSWYREPVENPVLAFWDAVLQPWRTYTSPAAFGTAPMGLAMQPLGMPVASFGMGFWPSAMPQNATAGATALMSFWQDAAQSMARGLADADREQSGHRNKDKDDQASDENAWKTMVAYHSDAGMAVARVFFPDHTTVSVKVPVPNSVFPVFKTGF